MITKGLALLALCFAATPASAVSVSWDASTKGGVQPFSPFQFLASGRKAAAVTPDPVFVWNNAALAAIKAEGTPPPMAARNLAILHAAIYDAVSRDRSARYNRNIAQKAAPSAGSLSVAAFQVLSHLYPKQHDSFQAAYDNLVQGASQAEFRWGSAIAEAILERRRDDGADAVVPFVPTGKAGAWSPTAPKFASSLLPQWPDVTPFTMTSGAQFRPAGAPDIAGPEFAAEFDQVKTLGSATSAVRTPEQAQIAAFWADGAGTVTPPGHWNQIAQDVAAAKGNTMEQNARLFALLNFALADAGIVAWDAKYAYDYWRPITAIREAGKAGNPAITADPDWTPLLATPPFPEYVSGHSTFSGAAAAVLKGFFDTDAVSFTTGSRSFTSFTAAAQEAGMSRIYGGIHFNSANVDGLNAGKALGEYVMSTALVSQ